MEIHQDYPKEKGNSFTFLMRTIERTMLRHVDVQGLERFMDIPKDERIIIATTHLADPDPQVVAAELSPYRPLDIAGLESNREDPIQGPVIKLLGRKHYHVIKNRYYRPTEGQFTVFAPENFHEMQSAMENGRDIVIAAHNGVRDGKLPKHPGMGAIYLAQLTAARILPVAVDIHAIPPDGLASDVGGIVSRLVTNKKPDATVIIGAPMTFPGINHDDLVDAGLFLSQHHEEMRKTPGRYKKAMEIAQELKAEASEIMQALAVMVPEFKRGKWGIPSSPAA